MREINRLYLIDASIPFFRYYFSMPNNWSSQDGESTSAVYGYTHWLKRFLIDVKPQCVVACFDESLGTCFRNEIDPGYKSSRPLPDHNIAYQFEACKAITEYMGVTAYASNRFEADDLIATLAAKNAKRGGVNIVVSADKDLIQIIRKGDSYWNYPSESPLSYDGCTQKMGVRPEQVADYLALVGDKIDDIPGVPGVGPKTAQALLGQFESFAEIMANLSSLGEINIRGAKALMQKLSEYKGQVLTAQKLTKVCTKATLNRRYQINKKSAQLDELKAFAVLMGFSLRNINL